MPNWCEGKLKIRGTKENIKEFLLTGLEACTYFGSVSDLINVHPLFAPGGKIEEKMHLRDEDDYFEMRVDIIREKDNEDFFSHYYIKGMRRAFIEEKTIEKYWGEVERKNDYEIVILDFKQAWNIDADDLAEVSKKYNVDFKIHGFELGMQFNRDIEIHNGVIIKNQEIKFGDYEWECINPSLGG